MIPDSWSDTLHDLIDLHGLALLTRSGFPCCTAVRAVPRQFCPGSRQREALVHSMACSESQDLKIDEGLSYKHSTGHWDLSEVWNCIIRLSAEEFSSEKPLYFLTSHKPSFLTLVFLHFLLCGLIHKLENLSRHLGAWSNCDRGRRICLLFSVGKNKRHSIFSLALCVSADCIWYVC